MRFAIEQKTDVLGLPDSFGFPAQDIARPTAADYNAGPGLSGNAAVGGAKIKFTASPSGMETPID